VRPYISSHISREEGVAAEAAGFLGNLGSVFSSQFAYVKVRLKLAALEGKEAAIDYGIAAGLAIGGFLVALFGYLFLLIALLFLIASAAGGGNAWLWVTLGAALLHLGGAVGLLILAKNRIVLPMFPATRDEIKNDRLWLTTPANPN
jgi:uncharacterized membrane protein YqjE